MRDEVSFASFFLLLRTPQGGIEKNLCVERSFRQPPAGLSAYGSLIFPPGPPRPGGMPSGMTIEELAWRRIS